MGIQVAVSNNGHVTPWFCAEHSILQGLPLAQLIPLLPVEILANLLVGDMDIFMINGKKSLQSAIDILSYFQYQMGCVSIIIKLVYTELAHQSIQMQNCILHKN